VDFLTEPLRVRSSIGPSSLSEGSGKAFFLRDHLLESIDDEFGDLEESLAESCFPFPGGMPRAILPDDAPSRTWLKRE
jgi:hypothetical protein